MTSLGVDSIDLVMTNPPFYESEQELLSSASKKARPPLLRLHWRAGRDGMRRWEVAFVGRILSESLALRQRVQCTPACSVSYQVSRQ